MAFRKKDGGGRPSKYQVDHDELQKEKEEKPAKKQKNIADAARKRGFNGGKPLTEEQKERAAIRRSYSKIRTSERAQMIAMWESGEFTLKEIATKFQRSIDYISRYFTVNGHIKGSKAEEYAREIRQMIQQEMMGDLAETARKIKALKEDYLTRIAIIKKMAQNEIASAHSKNLPLQVALPNLRAIQAHLNIVIACRAEEYSILGVSDFEAKIEQDDVPELLVSELTNQDIQELRAAQEREGGMSDVEEIKLGEIEEQELVDE